MRTALLTRDGVQFKPEYFETSKSSFGAQVKETDKMVLASIEMPGVDESSLDLKVEDQRLIIKGEKIEGISNSVSTISRSISLSKDIDSDKIEATLKNGILYLVFPKIVKPEAKKVTLSKDIDLERLLN